MLYIRSRRGEEPQDPREAAIGQGVVARSRFTYAAMQRHNLLRRHRLDLLEQQSSLRRMINYLDSRRRNHQYILGVRDAELPDQ